MSSHQIILGWIVRWWSG